jgi:hypothetical protein
MTQCFADTPTRLQLMLKGHFLKFMHQTEVELLKSTAPVRRPISRYCGDTLPIANPAGLGANSIVASACF